MQSLKYFRARVQKSGNTLYYFDKGGKPRVEIPLGADYVLAVKKWSELTRSDAPEIAMDFEGLATRYEREVLPTKAATTQAVQRGQLKLLREFFCSPTPAPIDKIRPSHVHALLQWQKTRPTQANHLKRLFSHMFNMARAWGYTDRPNPCDGIRGLKIEITHKKITDNATFKAIWDAAPANLREAMDLAYLTGQRPQDVLKMSIDDISGGYLHIEQGKGKERLRIVIAGELAALIERITRRKEASKWAVSSLLTTEQGLPMTYWNLRTAWNNARAAAASATNDKMLAKRIVAMWFRDLRGKAADDVSDQHGDQAAANLLGNDVKVTQNHYLTRGKIVPSVA
jgi:integrase